jgi:Flp pilus assembly protein TadB
MPADEQQPRPWLGRIFALETFLGLIGIFLLAAGIYGGHAITIFWGITTVGGLLLLRLVRKKDWQKHWEEKSQQFPTRKEER